MRGKMEAEMREAFKDIKSVIDKIDGKLDTHLIQFQAHCVEDARVQQQILSSSQSAHKRIDEHGEDHKTERSGRFSLWIGIILAFLSAVFAMVLGWFGKEKP
jgi:hypothetical protein